mgnify:CR=1 FL=1
MFEAGNIIYFDPFYFKNGNSAKSKYFIVLKANPDGKNILAILPTRKDSVPAKDTVEQGCVELPDINLNCYVISSKTEITTCKKCFDFKTHIYGHQIDLYESDLMREIYPIEGTDYEIWGKMEGKLFVELIECLRTSRTVKKKFIKLLA